MPGSELVTLFGDELPEVDSARIGLVVASGVKADMRALAQMLVALAVAQLLDQGAATLTETEVKKRLRTRRTLVLKSTPAGEGFTAAVARTAADGIALDELVTGLMGGASATPETALVRGAQAQLVETGAVAEAKRGGVGRFSKMLGGNPFEIQAGAAEALRPQWQQMLAQWTAWKGANPELAQQLLDGCRAAVSNSRDTSD